MMEPNADDSIIYCQDDLMPSSFVVFEDMRGKGELVDYKITVQNRPFSAHRLVLAATIPYFRTAFTDSKENVSLEDIDPDLLQCVFDFAYSGKIKISLKNVQNLLTVTKILEIKKIHDACWEFLEKRLQFGNVWETRQLAESFQCLKAISSSDHFIRDNFAAFSRSESFLVLPFSYLKEVLSRDDLKVGTEEDVFEAVIRWVKASPSERRDLFHELFVLVRVALLTPDYLVERISTEELVKSQTPSTDLVEKAKNYHLLSKKRSRFPEFTARPRIYEKKFNHPERDSNVIDYGIYAVSWNHFSTSVKYVDVENEKLVDLITTDSKHISEIVGFREMIYIFSNNTIQLFNVKTLAWSSLDFTHDSVLLSGIVLHEGMIYVFGGEINVSDKVRCFDPRKIKWLEEGKMVNSLELPGVASMKEFIYITGGLSRVSGPSNSMTRYDPQTKKWKKLSSMLSRRFDHSCVNLNNKIYVSGGMSFEGMLHTAEVHDPLTNQWNSISPMKRPKSSFTTVSYNGKLYALGRVRKDDSPGNLNRSAVIINGSPVLEVETYDPQNDKWETKNLMCNSLPYETFLVKAEVHPEVIKKGLSTAQTSTPRQEGEWFRMIPPPNVLTPRQEGEWFRMIPPGMHLMFIEHTKNLGNDLYRNQRYAEASGHYITALRARQAVSLGLQPGDGMWEKLKEMEIPLLLNLAQSRLKEKDYFSAIKHTTSVLEVDPDNVKALYRRAKAHMGADILEQAELDFRIALHLDPSLESVVKEDLEKIETLRKQKNI